MPIKLEFYSLEERKPKHQEDIVFLKRSYGFFEEFQLIERTVEYCWFGLDKNGSLDGNQYCYSEETDSENKIGDIITSEIDGSKWILYAMVDGYIMDEDYFWTTSDEYHNSLPYKD